MHMLHPYKIILSVFLELNLLCCRCGVCQGHEFVPHCVSPGYSGRTGSHPAVPALPVALLLQVCEKATKATGNI